MTGEMIVLSTCASAAEAETIARRLLEVRLAACVNVLAGVRSFYWWQGAIENTTEWLLVIKSSQHLFEQLRAEIEAIHPYQIPEILALPVQEGSSKYLEWLKGELRARPGS